jgi:hypothetical protein
MFPLFYFSNLKFTQIEPLFFFITTSNPMLSFQLSPINWLSLVLAFLLGHYSLEAAYVIFQC